MTSGGPGSTNLCPSLIPDGTVIWTAPTGHTYTTEPAGALMFPALGQSTGELIIPPARRARHQPHAVMPTRKQTREQTAATASSRNGANEPGSSPKKNDNAKPGSPPITSRHPSSASLAC